MIRTFIDAGCLIAATRSFHSDAERAISFLEDPGRFFLTSPFVYLEVVPKAKFYGRQPEWEFYDRYFKGAVWYREVARIEATAQSEAIKSGLSAMDALHVAAAHLAHADEFITTEKPAKPIHRASLVKVLYLFA